MKVCYGRGGYEGEVGERPYGEGMEGEQSKKVGKQVENKVITVSKQM